MLIGESLKRKLNGNGICLLDLSLALYSLSLSPHLSLMVNPKDTKASTHKVYSIFSAIFSQQFHLVTRVSHLKMHNLFGNNSVLKKNLLTNQDERCTMATCQVFL